MSTVLGNVGTVLTWMLSSMSEICTWLIGNELGGIYLAIFIIGSCIGLMFRTLHSA